MGVKLGIAIPLTILIIFSSLIKDVEPNSLSTKSRESRALRFNPIEEGRKAISLINDFTTLVLGLDGIVQYVKDDQTDAEFQGNVSLKLGDILKKIDNVDSKLTSLRDTIGSNKVDLVEAFASEVDREPMKIFLDRLFDINEEYNDHFFELRELADRYGYDVVAEHIAPIEHNDNLIRNLRKLVNDVKPQSYGKSIFQMVIDHSTAQKKNHRDCDSSSTRDKIVAFYENIVTTVFKGYTMVVLAYQYKKINSDKEAAFIKEEQERYQKINKKAIVAITDSVTKYLELTRSIKYNSTYVCDPETWKEGVNYLAVKNYAVMKATQECELPNQCDCLPSRKNRKYGIEYVISKQCTFPFQNGGDGGFDTDNIKYSEYKNSSELIVVESCSKIYRTDQLFEDCIRDKSSDPYLSIRKLSLERASCNESNYHVMTSARFYEKDGFIGIEAQCGFLVDGKIDPKTVKWNTRNRDFYTRNNPPKHIVIDTFVNAFNLDDFVLPDGEFVTALQFTPYHPDNYISLVVEGRELYDPVKNFLYDVKFPKTNVHRPNEYYQAYRKEIYLRTLPQALTQRSKTYEMSKPGKNFIKISSSNVGVKGGFPSLVPFIDLNEYNPSHPLPLGGIGLMYKSVPGYSGFLTLKFISTKFTSYISPSYVDQFNITDPKLRY